MGTSVLLSPPPCVEDLLVQDYEGPPFVRT
ncbi:hypothetical protein COLO4_10569 [Corchorus olitorius]|uniref:Uncharacterized protein n=1 Tax=Corchorus olitorius TaxID=93759 RepID=A0A1R3K7Z4_9ROSI|nr:hypothetical protein COLO4_10569 [Corchorus olitorius]